MKRVWHIKKVECNLVKRTISTYFESSRTTIYQSFGHDEFQFRIKV